MCTEEKIENKNKWCVYKHTSPSGKVYIGITNNLTKRWGQFGKQYHSCNVFIRAILKYGWINFKHEVLFDGLSKNEAGELEVKLIEEYNSCNPQFGYNMSKGGFGCKNTYGFRRVCQYDFNGKYINTFESIMEASKKTNTSYSSISHCCRNTNIRKKANGFLWAYEGNKIDINNLYRPNCKKVYQLDEQKNIINKYNSASEAAKVLHCDPSSISKATKTNGTIKGYYWCYENEYKHFTIPNKYTGNLKKEIIQLDINNEIVCKFSCISDAVKNTKASRSGISQCLKGNGKTAGGYMWSYAYN